MLSKQNHLYPAMSFHNISFSQKTPFQMRCVCYIVKGKRNYFRKELMCTLFEVFRVFCLFVSLMAPLNSRAHSSLGKRKKISQMAFPCFFNSVTKDSVWCFFVLLDTLIVCCQYRPTINVFRSVVSRLLAIICIVYQK